MKKFLQLLVVSFAMAVLLQVPAAAAVDNSSQLLSVGGTCTVSGYAKAKSTDTSVATVSKTSDGIKITAVKNGEAKVRLYDEEGKWVARVYVLVANSNSFSYDTAKINLQKGTYVRAKAKVPSACTVKYVSSNPTVAKVGKNGKITGLKKGKTTISARVYYQGYKIKTFKKNVTVKNDPVAKQTTTRLKNGQTKKVTSRYIRYYNSKGKLIRTVDKKKKMLAVTYDDGPSTGTHLIIDTLKKNNSVATFMVVGYMVEYRPEVVLSAYNIGCEIGIHTWDHPDLTTLSASSIRSEITRDRDLVKSITGEAPVVMRPPGGAFNSTVKSVCKDLGLPLILWSFDSLDWKTDNGTTTYNNVINQAFDGAIVIMHDLHYSSCVASQTIIPKLIEKGYQLVTVSELGECRGGLEPGVDYWSLKK